MINYDDIIENLQTDSIIQLMTQLGADRYVEKETYVMFPTICHNAASDEASMKLYYYKNSHIFTCFTECGNMNIFQFLRHYYKTKGVSYDWYEDIYNVVLNCSTSKSSILTPAKKHKSYHERYERKQTRELQVYSEGVLDVFVKEYPVEWLNDNISKAAMDKFNIKYSISQNKIIIPHYDINGNLVGIRGRALDEYEAETYGKYMPIKIENTWYTHPLSLNLYGLNITKDNIKKNGICYLFESEKSVLQFESFSIPNCAVAVCGSNFNKYQLSILIKNCRPKEIVLCFDNEEENGKEKYFEKLWNLCKKYSNYCNFSFIYDRDKKTKLKDSPSDNGEEVFNYLLSRRVKVK